MRGVNNNGWWGEGEIKFFMDGDTAFPTICGTGTRIISAARTISTPSPRRHGPVSRIHDALYRASAGDPPATVIIRCSSASGSTAGTSWIRYASKRT